MRALLLAGLLHDVSTMRPGEGHALQVGMVSCLSTTGDAIARYRQGAGLVIEARVFQVLHNGAAVGRWCWVGGNLFHVEQWGGRRSARPAERRMFHVEQFSRDVLGSEAGPKMFHVEHSRKRVAGWARMPIVPRGTIQA
ncbi:MAG: hypothetical protein ACJA2W_002865 [Planctomycetota bacterium]|jgi:hypothetical protein